MQISIDSGDPKEIEQVLEWGFPINKVTSNPTTVSKTIMRDGGTVRDVVDKIRDTVGVTVPVSVETIGTPDYNPHNMDPEYFVREAFTIMGWDPYFVVKLPTVPEGLEAARKLRDAVPINFTLVFSRHQARLASVYGGMYVSPFVGRIDDKLGEEAENKREGMDLVREIAEDYRNENFNTKILTASTREERHLEKAKEYGSHVVTVPYTLFRHIYESRGDAGVKFIHNLRSSGRSYVPQNPRAPTFDASFDWSKMAPFEAELVKEGVKTFLMHAKNAGYSIL